MTGAGPQRRGLEPSEPEVDRRGMSSGLGLPGLVDRGAFVAGWVGVAMAATIAVSFLLVIPVGEAAVALLAFPAGLLIGYYANQRSERWGGPTWRFLTNAGLAGLMTGLAFALLFLGTKALFFAADDGYRDAAAGGRITCQQGADCVYRRYLADGRGPALEAAGVTDAASFSAFYWKEQRSTAGLLFGLTVVGAVGGGLAYGATNRRRPSGSGLAGG